VLQLIGLSFGHWHALFVHCTPARQHIDPHTDSPAAQTAQTSLPPPLMVGSQKVPDGQQAPLQGVVSFGQRQSPFPWHVASAWQQLVSFEVKL
jgi:hypothetical protein